MAKNKKTKKLFLKQKRAHKNGFRLGRHVIPMGPAKEYELNEAELKELERKGPQAWLKVVTKKEMDSAPKSNQENKEMQGIKNELAEAGIEIKGDESLEELRDIKEEAVMKEALKQALTDKGVEFDEEASIEELEFLLEEE